jgi:hypothetical protein
MINSTSNTEGSAVLGKREGLSLLRMDLRLKSETKSVAWFSVFGLGAGVASAEFGMSPVFGQRGSVYYQYFFWSGIFLLVALVLSFKICSRASWPRFGDRPERSILAAVVILLNPLPSIYVGLFSGVVTAALVASPPPHSWSFYAAPIVAVFVCGGLASAFIIAVALFIFTKIWDATAGTFLALSAVASSIAALSANPDALMTLRYMSKGQTHDGSFVPATLAFLIVDLTLCSACAGYWIAHTSPSPD